jgi:hypothetical protein
MASTYTGLGTQLMATGENAGTWGTKTNTNLNIIEQISGGYIVQTLNAAGAGANTTTLAVSDGSTGATLANRVIILGAVSAQAITGAKIVTIPLDVETFYIIKNSTSGAYTVQFKYVSGSGNSVTWSSTEKGYKILYAAADDATDPNIIDVGFGTGDVTLTGTQTLTNKTLTLPVITSISNSGTVTIPTGAEATGKIALDGIKWPNADGSADQIMTTNGSGVLSFVDNSGGTSWQAVITADPATATAGEGYFCNTTSAAFTVSLPAGSIGNEISFIDYAGTFDSNNLTVAPNGSEKIEGTAADLTVAVERAAFTLVFTDSTQGWLLKDK